MVIGGGCGGVEGAEGLNWEVQLDAGDGGVAHGETVEAEEAPVLPNCETLAPGTGTLLLDVAVTVEPRLGAGGVFASTEGVYAPGTAGLESADVDGPAAVGRDKADGL
jgi:hypothetical protein